MPSTQKLHALVIGINHFLHQRNLNGAVDDAKKMVKYLESLEEKFFPNGVNITFLKNEEATREEIILAFQEKLIKSVEKGDTAILYFSGHGGQEKAPMEFRNYEPDGLLEGLVCHDSGQDGTYLIADKELRYLIHQLYKEAKEECEIVTIFDCCHAGDNTRLELEEGVIEKRTSYINPERPVENFLFYPSLKFKEDTGSRGMVVDPQSIILPEGRHIQLAACNDDESAREHSLGKFGFFTDSILTTLTNSEGPISYYELIRLAQNYMETKSLNQTPKIYTPRGFQQDIYRAFLSQTMVDKPLKGNISYLVRQKKWNLDLGGIHGLTVTKEKETYPIRVDTGEEEPAYARISEVFTKNSTIEFAPYANTSIQETYKCQMSGLMAGGVSILTEGKTEDLTELQSIIEQQNDKLIAENILFIEDPNAAGYKVLVQNGSFSIVHNHDLAERLLTDFIRGTDSNAAQEVIDRFKHISKWTFIKNLKNNNTFLLGDDPIQLTVSQSGKKPQVLNSQNPNISIPFGDEQKGEQPPQITITLENRFQRPLHVACLYLSSLFGVEISYLEPYVVKLDPGQTVMLLNGYPISLVPPEHILSDNWPAEMVYLKILASTQDFEVNLFALPELPAPPSGSRGFIQDKGFANLNRDFDDWTTQLFTFSLINPRFKSE